MPQVIDAERFFHHIPGDEFKGLGRSQPLVHQDGKPQSQCDPESAAQQRLPERNNTPAPVQYSQIEKQEQEYDGIEDDPEADMHAM
jgi:hypothetical protein